MNEPKNNRAKQRAEKWTRRQYLTYRAIMDGAETFTAIEAVASTAIEHPEWDMDEARTWADWEDGDH